MPRRSLLLAAMILALSPTAACQPQGSRAAPDAVLVLEQTVPLKGVEGRIDHMAVDAAHHRLFVGELGNGSVEAVDLASGRSLGRITGLREPQGLAYLAASDELVVATGGDGELRFYHAADFAPLGAVALGDDADDVRVDPASGRVVVGYGSGALAVIDPATRSVVARLPMPAHPEGFQLGGGRAFVNVPDAHRVIIADMSSGRTLAAWPTTHGWNFPMALDPAHGTLAVAYRLPPRLQVLDERTGATRADIATCGDADDVFTDVRRGRLYVICGSGAVDVVATADNRLIARVATRAGARTGAFSPELDRLYVAARQGWAHDAAILVFRPAP